jgi:hypothetical protein
MNDPRISVWRKRVRSKLKGIMATNKKSTALLKAKVAPTCSKPGNETHVDGYAAMPEPQLDAFIDSRVKECTSLCERIDRRLDELTLALTEMEKRFDKKPGVRTPELRAQGWHTYLKSKGIKAATFRQWKHRAALKRLQAIAAVTPAAPRLAMVPKQTSTSTQTQAAAPSHPAMLTCVTKPQSVTQVEPYSDDEIAQAREWLEDQTKVKTEDGMHSLHASCILHLLDGIE